MLSYALCMLLLLEDCKTENELLYSTSVGFELRRKDLVY